MTKSEFYNRLEPYIPNIQKAALQLTKNMDTARKLYEDTSFKALQSRDNCCSNGGFENWIKEIMFEENRAA